MKKSRLFIIGSGGFGRELESWLELIPDHKRNWEIAGYFDTNIEVGQLPFPSEYENFGDESVFQFKKDDLAILSVANPIKKERIYNKLKGKVNFFTYIAPNVVMGKFNDIGEGSIVCPNCVITTNVKIGKGVLLNCGTQIGHDVIIEDFSSIMPNVDLGGGVHMKERVFVGTNATIVPNKKIESDVKITAGSVVVRNLKSGEVVYGNPNRNL